MRKLNKYFTLALLAGVLSFAATSCSKDYLETSPTSSVDKSVIFENTTNAYMALNGMYRHMYQYLGAHGQAGHMSAMIATELMGEDMFPRARGYGWYVSDYNYTEVNNANGGRTAYLWAFYYDLVNNANQIIANVPNAVGPESAKNHLMAQAYAMRAFGHLNAVQLYAKAYIGNENELGVPVYTEPTSIGKARSTNAETYEQIIADLDSADARFAATSAGSGPISYITRAVARGFKARAYLNMGEWALAEEYANLARAGRTLMTQQEYIGDPVNEEDPKSGAFTVANNEWMWGSYSNDEQATIFASWLSHMDPTTFGYAQLGNMRILNVDVYNHMSNDDVRKKGFADAAGVWAHDPSGYWDWWPYMMYKFRRSTTGWEQSVVYMRVAEMYLIEAEAIARQGGRDGEAAQVLHDLVSERDNSYVLPTLTGQDLIDEILMQRRIELVGEGFRFNDIKRLNQPLVRVTGATNSGRHDGGLAITTSIPAGNKLFTFLIPKQEMDSNPLMVQNEL